MSILEDQIAQYTAALEREMPAPTGDLGFGSDLDCVDDITPDVAEIPGDSMLAIAQSNYRRITTRRGSLPDAPDDGIDLTELLNHGITQTRLVELEGQIRNEVRKDDRNETVDVTMTNVGPSAYDIAIRGTTAEGPFSLTFAVVDGDATLKEINGGAAD